MSDHIMQGLAFMAGMAIAIVFYYYAYLKYEETNALKLKISKQSSQWKDIEDILNESFDYYKKLPLSLKDDFIFRTNKFMKSRKWLSPHRQPLDLNKKVLISASATQLTFGLKDFSFGRFKTILVHNDIYYNRITHTYHKGEVNKQGIIVLSWKHFEQGYNDANDKINLGLHEMAHALDLAIHLSQGRQYNLQRLLEKFEHSAFKELIEMRSNNNHFFRKYGATNVQEFFSVAVEHFFEAPVDFRDKLPELYYEMCQLLHQDPCNSISRGFTPPSGHTYSNDVQNMDLKHIKPTIKLHPNINLLMPVATTTLLFILLIPVVNYYVNNWSLLIILIITLAYILLTGVLLHSKAQQLLLINNHILFGHYPWCNKQKSIHLKNIINISFTYMLTHYQTNISYFEKEDIFDSKVLLYCSSSDIRKLERLLLKRDIVIKHNNKWLQKESAK